MTALAVRVSPASSPVLDMEFVRGFLLYFAIACLFAAPFVRDPLAFAAGGVLPWLMAIILARPEIPAVLFYFVMTHWMQVVARLILSWTENESLSDSLWGVNLPKAYWYSLFGMLVLTLGIRVGFAGMVVRRAAVDDAGKFGLTRVLILYLATLFVSLIVSRVAPAAGGLAQPLHALAGMRLSALFLLFTCALCTSGGGKWIVATMAIEIGIGFTGLFADFKMCFLILAMAALASRPTLRPGTLVTIAGSAVVFLALLLFWTGVKAEYRAMSTGFSNTQRIAVTLDERVDWLVQKALSPGDMDWGDNADQLVRRLAYIDFFASTISALETSDTRSFGNWSDVFSHILRPRLLFPDKDIVEDSAVVERLAQVEIGDSRTTSISVGYFSENFADFRFPMMLLPIFVLGVLVALAARYFLTRPIEAVAGQAFALAVVLPISLGTSNTLVKFVAPLILSTIVFAAIAKFAWPTLTRALRG